MNFDSKSIPRNANFSEIKDKVKKRTLLKVNTGYGTILWNSFDISHTSTQYPCIGKCDKSVSFLPTEGRVNCPYVSKFHKTRNRALVYHMYLLRSEENFILIKVLMVVVILCWRIKWQMQRDGWMLHLEVQQNWASSFTRNAAWSNYCQQCK